MTGLFNGMASSARAMIARLSPVRFARKEEGTVTAFAMMIFVLMAAVSGIAVDVMRFETQRAQLQYTLDRAILAAASLTQPYDPRGVVEDYFRISGIEGYRLDVRVEQGLNFRRVHAYAELEVRSLFMQLFGVRVMSTPAIGAAEERVNEIEVSMVLDISGSMASNNRMTNLRPAARDFVTQVLEVNVDPTTGQPTENLVSISIVPYNDRVNSGPLIEQAFTFDTTHSQSACARFSSVDINYSFDADLGPWDPTPWGTSDFLSTAIDPDQPIRRMAHFTRRDYFRDQRFTDNSREHCERNQIGILPWEHRENVLHQHINNLITDDFTAIDVGMNWGVALLDPTAGPAVQRLVAANEINPAFADRPAPFRDGDPTTREDDETVKVIVLMTDGANTEQWDIASEYWYGFSPIFYHQADDRYSIWHPGRNQFWIPDGNPRAANGRWRSEPHRGFGEYGITEVEWTTNGSTFYAQDPNLDGYIIPWTNLWENFTGEYMAEEWFEQPARQSGDWTYHNRFINTALDVFADRNLNPNPADVNLRAICDAARAAEIVVFTIGFEAPAGGQEVMRYCATTDAHYYDVDGLEIEQAFENIARAINQLRLIQ